MTKKLLARPSSLERVMACPGSLRAADAYPFTDSPAAQRGRLLHDAMALLFQSGGQGWKQIETNPNIAEKDLKILRDCWELGQSLLPDDPGTIILIEKKLDLAYLNLTGGTPDAVFISPKYAGAVVIDWKFGAGPVEDPQANPQQWCYSSGTVRTQQIAGLELESIESVIVQPASWKPDDRVRSHVFERKEILALEPTIRAAVDAANDPGAPFIAGDKQCKFCPHKENCGAYTGWAAGIQETKRLAEETAIRSVTAGTPITAEPAEPLALPVVVVSAEIVAQAEEKKAHALSLKVVDQHTADQAGRLSKDIRALRALIDKNRTQVKKPVLDLGRSIDDAAKQATIPLDQAADYLDGQVSGWIRIQREEEEARRREEERRRREAEEAQRRAQEEAARARREAEEAQKRAAEAQDQAAREKAAREAQEAKRRAEAQEAARLAAEQEQQAAEMAAALAPEPAQKVAGYRTAEKVSWQIPDVAAVPDAIARLILIPDKRTVDSLIKAGKISDGEPWIQITRETVAARSR